MLHALATRDTNVPEGAIEMDVVYVGLTVGFFVVSWAFLVACERLS
jgi:hypothetical protein